MQFGENGDLLRGRVPVALAHGFEHHRRHFLKGVGVLPTEEVLYLQVVAVLHVHLVEAVPKSVVDGGGLHDVPSVGVPERLGEVLRRGGAPFLHFADVRRIEHGRPRFRPYRFVQVGHPRAAHVAEIVEIGVRVLPGDVPDRHAQPTHELVDVVQTQGSPGMALPGLDDDLGVRQRRLEHAFGEMTP